MKRIMMLGVVSALMISASVALADSNSDPYRPVTAIPSNNNSFRAGFDLSLGAPSGAELGFVFEPFTHWTRLELGLTHSVTSSFGGMASATFTPIKFPIMPVLFVEGGFLPEGSLPSFVASGKTLPTMGYDWLSVGPGLEFGSRDHVVFFLHPALTYIHLTTGNFQAVVDDNGGSNTSGLKVANPTASGWVMPTGRIGLSILF
jgi:hypothetical protein